MWGLTVHRLRGEHHSENTRRCQDANQGNTASRCPSTATKRHHHFRFFAGIRLDPDRRVPFATAKTTASEEVTKAASEIVWSCTHVVVDPYRGKDREVIDGANIDALLNRSPSETANQVGTEIESGVRPKASRTRA